MNYCIAEQRNIRNGSSSRNAAGFRFAQQGTIIRVNAAGIQKYFLIFCNAINHPVHAKLIGATAIVRSPEHILQFHCNNTAGRKRIK
jgi:hypothetical protein